ncbi:MAG: hypothetical protein RQ801_06080 [Spirochaetaceae bacterium]|nr:hypothetical protein [Spirochaetaceae bacterium]
MKHAVILSTAAVLSALIWAGCGSSKSLVMVPDHTDRYIVVSVEPGEKFRHPMKVMPLVTVRNPPQMAIWLETIDGVYVETLLLTRRTGEQSWRKSPDDDISGSEITRPEALPVWSARGVDASSAATPKSGFERKTSIDRTADLVIWLEVNHSTDFNSAYPQDAVPGQVGYSGGPWGSGQPSLIYRADLETAMTAGRTELNLIGHGSPDGTDGLIYSSLEGITDARSIVGHAVAVME